MAGTMVAFNPRGDHFIPLPVPLGRWGSAPPDFSSLLSLHHCKEEVGLGGWEMCGSRAWLVVSLWLSFLFATQRESFPSPERVVSGRQGIGSSEMLPTDSKAWSLVEKGSGAAKCSRPIPKLGLWSRRVREQRNAPDRFQSRVFGPRGGRLSELWQLRRRFFA